MRAATTTRLGPKTCPSSRRSRRPSGRRDSHKKWTDARGPVTTYNYDNVGNRIADVVAGNLVSYNYDAAGHTTTQGGVNTAGYRYDFADRLVYQGSNSETRLFFHDGLSNQIAVETDDTGTAKTRYVLGSDGQALANEDATKPGTTGRGHYLLDPRGNVATVVDGTNNVKATFAYDAYGRGKPTGTSLASGWDSRLRFQASPRDPSSGSYTLGPRLYDPSTYRFIGADTMLWSNSDQGLQADQLTGNRYLYAGANPASLVDDGHKPRNTTGRRSPVLWCIDSSHGGKPYVCSSQDPGRKRTGWKVPQQGWANFVDATSFEAAVAVAIIEVSLLRTPSPGAIEDDLGDLQTFADQRSLQLQRQLPTASQGRVTMSAGVLEDSAGNRIVAIATSEPNGYLRRGVTLNPGEVLIRNSSGHAETNIVEWANQNGYRVITVGAGRPHCPACVTTIEGSGATTASSRR